MRLDKENQGIRPPGRERSAVESRRLGGPAGEIMLAARTLFERRGVGKTTVKDIAAEANVTRELVYYYFETKQAVIDAVIDEYVDSLGCGVASLVNIFQPEVICIGGGPSAQGETLMAPVRYILNREDYARNNLHRTRLVRAALGNDAGLIGAALLPLFR